MKTDCCSCFCPYAHHSSFLNTESSTMTTDFWISNWIKKIRVLSFLNREEHWHQFMEEIWGILNSRWQIITLGFQIYIFGEERAINEEEEKESLMRKRRKSRWQFSENPSIWSLTIFCKSINLVPAYVASDVVSLVRG